MHMKRAPYVYVPPPPRVPSFPPAISEVFERATQQKSPSAWRAGGVVSGESEPGARAVRNACPVSATPLTADWFDAHISTVGPTEEVEGVDAAAVLRIEAARRRRQRIVVSAVCVLGLGVLALAAFRGTRPQATGLSSVVESRAIAPVAVVPVPTASPPVIESPPTPSAATALPVAPSVKASRAKPQSRPSRSHRVYRPQSIQ